MSPQSRHLVKRLFMLQLIQSLFSPRHFPLLYLCTLAFEFSLWADLKPEPILNTINAGEYHHNAQGQIYLYSTLLLLWIPKIVWSCIHRCRPTHLFLAFLNIFVYVHVSVNVFTRMTFNQFPTSTSRIGPIGELSANGLWRCYNVFSSTFHLDAGHSRSQHRHSLVCRPVTAFSKLRSVNKA
jgi:hypothetical protein